MANITLAPPDQTMQVNPMLLIPVSLYHSLQINLTELIHQLQIALRQRPSTMREILSLYHQILKTKETLAKHVKQNSLPVSEYPENPTEEKPNQTTELYYDRGNLPEAINQLNSSLKAWALLQSKTTSGEKKYQIIDKLQINLALITSFINGNLPVLYSGSYQDFEPEDFHLKAG